MPNWCENKLYITGPQREQVLAGILNSKGEFDLNKLVRDIAEWFPFKKVGRWYAWRIKYWGVKWNILECFVRRTKSSISLSFSSPWAPPEAIIPRLSTRFPNNTFKLKYWEGGCGFKGVLTMKNGDVLQESYNENYRGPRGG